MSHIHLPDGFLPPWLWVSGYVITVLLLMALWWHGKATADPRKFSLMGAMGAIMILIAMIEIPPFEYHANLSVVTGIILGPQLFVLTAFVVNIILALIGHGGLTVIGLNTLVLSTEAIIGCYAFRLLTSSGLSVGRSTFIATIAGLASGTFVTFGIIAAGSSWINHVLGSAALGPGMELPPGVTGAHLNLKRLAIIMFAVGSIGWVGEAILSSAIIGHLTRLIPSMVKAEDDA
ncbi:MAG: energy-coupling factor ABC transporter permease [Armatimonadota bacterium]